ncbi:MAG: hypothetical protein J0H14_04075 [Alphaproteobacteria bacterium]|nr:hypothetical protein [Alphaproteobacteria bacterium]
MIGLSTRGLIAAVLLLGCGTTMVSAQQPTKAQADAIRQSCRADYQSHCAGVPTGGKEALACLQQNAAGLSPGCQHALAAVASGGASAAKPAPSAAAPQAAPGPGAAREKAEQVREACGMDYRQHCRGVPPGGGRAISCLAEHEASLSPGCQRAMSAMRQAR